jgi:hypothetical protein
VDRLDGMVGKGSSGFSSFSAAIVMYSHLGIRPYLSNFNGNRPSNENDYSPWYHCVHAPLQEMTLCRVTSCCI